MGYLYLAIKIPQILTTTTFSNLLSHTISLLIAALSHLRLFKSPPDPDNFSSTGAGAILILDGTSPSLHPVPVHVITAAIKSKVSVIPYSDFVSKFGGPQSTVCSICIDCIDGDDSIRELVNCKHVFHRVCLDRWVDEGQIYCPLCRSILLPPKKILSGRRAVAGNEVDPAM
ncbi:probable E3 ubiquitin-protein ligase RHA1A [Rutidosis leptorrhynchoides]|uniref:probable E3 ubiquitin-protein ligase RHA1A n=1 Tax=Rutidosis leptorrhynchoides TaxID=125765 RepID=UPI003A98D9D8